MASATASAVFSGNQASTPSGGGSTAERERGAKAGGTIGGAVFGPGGAAIGAGAGGLLGNKTAPISNFGDLIERKRLDEDPFRKAAREQQEAAEKALETAKGLQTTTDESGTSTTAGTTSETSQTTFAPKSRQEQELLNASIANYQKQQGLVKQQEAGIKARGGVQTAARGGLQDILGGQAFDLSASEQARIGNLRQANIDASSNAVNALLNERLGELQADAARRGVRGQAYSQLQGDVLGEAAKSLERSSLDANRIAAEQAISMPGQRAQIQAGTAGQFAGFADELQQQAIQNRQALQDPIALQQMRDERLKAGKTQTTGAKSDTTTSAGKSTQTGLGQAEILANMAGLPSETAAQTGAVGTIFGGIMGAAGG